MEPEQFCDLVLTARLADVMDTEHRNKDYPQLDLDRLVLLLAKYREVGDKASYTGYHLLGRSKQPEVRIFFYVFTTIGQGVYWKVTF